MKDVFEVLEKFMPLWLSLIVLCVGYLVFLYKKIFRKMNDLAEKQSQYLKERIDSVDKATTIFERAINRQESEIKQLNDMLNKAGVNPQSYDILEVISSVQNDLKNPIKLLTEKIEMLNNFSDNDFDTILSLANAYATNGEWIKSAEQYEKATKIRGTLWELYFSQGIAFANSRMGKDTELKSLQSYSSAITFVPDEMDYNTKARLYIYKGAILKRLYRLKEAENDIKIGLEYADEEYEVSDGLYNLACIYAMQNKKIEYSKIAKQLKNNNTSKFHYLIRRISEYAPEFNVNE
jgi:tetratricopeptide (TPR) repeat protein